MKYEKVPINPFKTLNLYPIYSDTIYRGREPFKIVGIRENETEIEGDFSGGTHDVMQKDWFKDSDLFMIKEVCEEQEKVGGCQVHNINCCGGGRIVSKHIKYWNNLK